MKKLMCAVAAVAAGVAFAEDAAVQSADIVGYTTSALRFQSTGSEVSTMMSIPFRGIENEYVPLSDIKITNMIGGHDLQWECDYIQIWEDDHLEIYYYCVDEDLWYTGNGNTPMEDLPRYANGIKVGTPFWFTCYTKGERPLGNDVQPTLTVSGAVKSEAFRTYDLRYQSTGSEVSTMLCNPFPVNWKIWDSADCEITNMIKGHDLQWECDYIQIWEDDHLEIYYYCEDEDLWYTGNGNTPMEDVARYADGIKPNTPFWFTCYTKGTRPLGDVTPTLTFYNPVAE